MTLKDMQQQVDVWVDKHTSGYWQPLEIMARLTEEVGELARELNHRYGPKKKKATEETKEIGDEIGDVLFTLACLANSHKIDLDEAFSRIMEKCYGRDKERFAKK